MPSKVIKPSNKYLLTEYCIRCGRAKESILNEKVGFKMLYEDRASHDQGYPECKRCKITLQPMSLIQMHYVNGKLETMTNARMKVVPLKKTRARNRLNQKAVR
jgi:hypothetical protein